MKAVQWKPFAFGALVALVAVLLAAATDQPPTEAGRYQVFAGKYRYWDMDPTEYEPGVVARYEEQPGVWLVDTATGESWSWVSAGDVSGWLKNKPKMVPPPAVKP